MRTQLSYPKSEQLLQSEGLEDAELTTRSEQEVSRVGPGDLRGVWGGVSSEAIGASVLLLAVLALTGWLLG